MCSNCYNKFTHRWTLGQSHTPSPGVKYIDQSFSCAFLQIQITKQLNELITLHNPKFKHVIILLSFFLHFFQSVQTYLWVLWSSPIRNSIWASRITRACWSDFKCVLRSTNSTFSNCASASKILQQLVSYDVCLWHIKCKVQDAA